jgi:hypothetical protein
MTGKTGKNAGGKKKKGNAASNAVIAFIAVIIVIGVAVLGGLGWMIYQQRATLAANAEAKEAAKIAAQEKRDAELRANPPPRKLVNDSVDQTVRYAAEHGWEPCPGDCLKLSTPGWHHEVVKNHPPTDIWFRFKHAGGWMSYNQNHIGHIIERHIDSAAKDVGICPVCEGAGWVKKSSG